MRRPDVKRAARVAPETAREAVLQGEAKDSTGPVFRNRRTFLCWAVACGFVKPERLTERILADIEREAI